MGLGTSPVISTVVYVLLVGSFGLVRNLATALGEEIGWRSFLVPELFKTMGFYHHCSVQRRGVGLLALSHPDLG